MLESFTKDAAVSELRRTVTFLLIESRKGRESIELDMLLEKRLQQNIIHNFDDSISADDYEQVVRELFDKGDALQLGDFEPKEVSEATIRLIREGQIRDPDAIMDKIGSELNIHPDDTAAVRELVVRIFQADAKNQLRDMLKRAMRAGEIDDKKLARQAQEMGFDFSPTEILKEVKHYRRVMREEESKGMKSRLLQRRQRRPGIVREDREEGASSAAVKLHEERMRKSIAEGLIKSRKQFIASYCTPFKFEQLENVQKDGKRVFLHRAANRGTEVLVQTIAAPGTIENVLIGLSKTIKGRRQRIRFDAISMDRYAGTPESMKIFSKQMHQCNKLLELDDIQQVLWFFTGVLGPNKGLPMKGVEFLKDKLLTHISKLDQSLHHHAVARAVAKRRRS